MSGREMFVFNPDLFVDDDEAADDETYKADEDYSAPDESYKNTEQDGQQEEEVLHNFFTPLLLPHPL